jgi:hypothetical protein
MSIVGQTTALMGTGGYIIGALLINNVPYKEWKLGTARRLMR